MRFQAMLMTTHAEHITSLFANLVGTLYYVMVAALLVPFRNDLDVGVAGFMVVNGCFASLGTTYVACAACAMCAVCVRKAAATAHGPWLDAGIIGRLHGGSCEAQAVRIHRHTACEDAH